MNDILLPLLVAIPLGGAFLAPLVGKIHERLSDLLANLVTFALLILSVIKIGSSPAIYQVGGWAPPLGIVMVADGLSILLVVTVNAISFAVSLYSVPYMRRYTSGPKYYTLFLLMVAGMNGVVLSGDLFNLYVFLEVAAIASYALVAFGCEHEELEAAFKYLILGSVASTFILFGIGIVYGVTGSLNMAHVGQILRAQGMGAPLSFASALFLMGFGLKAAMVPFHAWLPDAHPSAPAPISAMLSGVLIKALGVYSLVRIFNVVFPINALISTALMTLGLLSMVVGVLLAVGQWDFKRLLAYHSISQMGYVMLGVGIGTPLGMLGGLFHLMNHAAFKSLLFLCSGAIEHRADTRKLKEMGGLIRRMPITGTTCSIASLSISGVPPFNGFWSKLIIILAAVQAGRYAIAAATVAVSFLTLVSFIKVQRYSLFGELPGRLSGLREAPALMCVSMVVLALLCVSLGLLYPLIGPSLLEPARNVLTDAQAYITVVLGR